MMRRDTVYEQRQVDPQVLLGGSGARIGEPIPSWRGALATTPSRGRDAPASARLDATALRPLDCFVVRAPRNDGWRPNPLTRFERPTASGPIRDWRSCAGR